jgi:predicted nucleotidyltransferase
MPELRPFQWPLRKRRVELAISVDQELIDEIVRRVLSVARAERIILFGSAATGAMTPDSDVDVLILKSDAPNARHESVRVREALRGLRRPFDVIVMPTESFEESKNVIGGIAYPANKYGKVIYAAV